MIFFSEKETNCKQQKNNYYRDSNCNNGVGMSIIHIIIQARNTYSIVFDVKLSQYLIECIVYNTSI